MSDIKLKHAGKTIVAMGGGPSLPASAARVNGDVWISANDHGARLRQCDYCASVDSLHLSIRGEAATEDYPTIIYNGEPRVHMYDFLAPFGLPIISYRAWADHVTGMEAAVFDSGFYAAYCAWLMGGAPVVIIGVDCYAGDTYWHAPTAHSGGHNKAEAYFNSRSDLLRDIIGAERVRMLGDGPLAKRFPQYDPAETFDVDFEDVTRKPDPVLNRTRVRCNRSGVIISGIGHQKGNLVDCNLTQDVRNLIDRCEVVECR